MYHRKFNTPDSGQCTAPAMPPVGVSQSNSPRRGGCVEVERGSTYGVGGMPWAAQHGEVVL